MAITERGARRLNTPSEHVWVLIEHDMVTNDMVYGCRGCKRLLRIPDDWESVRACEVKQGIPGQCEALAATEPPERDPRQPPEMTVVDEVSDVPAGVYDPDSKILPLPAKKSRVKRLMEAGAVSSSITAVELLREILRQLESGEAKADTVIVAGFTYKNLKAGTWNCVGGPGDGPWVLMMLEQAAARWRRQLEEQIGES